MTNIADEAHTLLGQKKEELLEGLYTESGMSYLSFKEAGEWVHHQRGGKDVFELNGVPKVSVWIDTAARGSITVCWSIYEEETC